MSNIISQEEIELFLNGADPEKYIVGIEYDYRTNTIWKVIQDPDKGKLLKKDKFVPFLWLSDISKLNFYGGDRGLQKKKMGDHGILIEKLDTHGDERLENGMTYMVKCIKGYTNLISFFKQGGLDPWSEEHRKYFTVLPVASQYMIQKRKRLFKGIDDYNDVHRLVFDIETTGLDPEVDKIILIGLKDNRGFHKSIPAFGEHGEKLCIIEFFTVLKTVNPTIFAGFNSASFDLPFIVRRAEILGLDLKKLTQKYDERGLKRRDGVLKLASEVESYNHFNLFGFNIIDVSHGVRRAMAINSDIKFWNLKYINTFLEKEKENRIYVDGSLISKIYLDDEKFYINPKTGKYKKIGEPGTDGLLEKYPGCYEIWGGQKIVEQYLDDDLHETIVADDAFSQATFLVSKLVPTTYERSATMGTATLWKLIMLAWSFDHNLAIPKKKEKRKFTGGLSRLLSVGYDVNIVKFDFSSLYPAIQLVNDIFPKCDVMGVQKSLLTYFRNIRIFNKQEMIKYEKTNPTLSEEFNRKQLPIKIFINAYFGSLSAPHVFDWGDIDLGEFITCIGRQSLRMIIMFYHNKGYKGLVMDTDGVNFASPPNVEDRRYIGKGYNELVEKGKLYTGVEADTAEFNDIFMRNEMGLDIDYKVPSCINLSKKNYIIKKSNGKIKLTGNTVKGKKLSQYIVEFLDEGLPHLLNGDGPSFLEVYYRYITNISEGQIPLSKIANKARVKQTVKEYEKYCKQTTKAGHPMARQAHMELIMKNDYPATLGETIYYVNTGKKKSDGDVQRVKQYDKKYSRKELNAYFEEHGEKPIKKSVININCEMISQDDIKNNPDALGEYNTLRYIDSFNKKVLPFLVVFKPEIRNDILIINPKDRQYFTDAQCELDSGHPMKEEQQDKIEEVMTLSDTEVTFWNNSGLDPYFMYPDDSVDVVDKYWVDHNRQVLKLELESVKNNKEESIIDSDSDFLTI